MKCFKDTSITKINQCIYLILPPEDPPVGGTDIDIQLLDAAKAGDLELVKVICLYCLLLLQIKLNTITEYLILDLRKRTDC